MNVTVNGAVTGVRDGLTAGELLDAMGIKPERVVVEVNLEPVSREAFSSVVLKEEDRIEIIAFMAGG